MFPDPSLPDRQMSIYIIIMDLVTQKKLALEEARLGVFLCLIQWIHLQEVLLKNQRSSQPQYQAISDSRWLSELQKVIPSPSLPLSMIKINERPV
ncbi:hypothetical protein VTL71DRAFT_8307 [Oculimacula yallundae]|uniref:Uncharacterized protein n=1 Tax=Oculimacula yallundae TaxID=86028 RepID=A0ABR4CX81_9HELO